MHSMQARSCFLVGTLWVVVLHLGLLLAQNFAAAVSFSVTLSAVSNAFSGWFFYLRHIRAMTGREPCWGGRG